MSAKDERTRDVTIIGGGIQPSHVRQTNQRAILSVISLRPGISNAELARLTDLAPQTVSSVLADLEQRHLVLRGDVLRGKRGQPATPLYMNPVGAYSIGAEIGWRHIEVCLVGIGTQVLKSHRRHYDAPDASTVFGELAAATDSLLADLSPADRARVTGLGLSAPLTLGNPPELVVPDPAQRRAWQALDIVAETKRATGLDTTLYVDGHAACWAQRVANPAPRPLAFVFILLDTCMSGGIVSENLLWQGADGASGNLGELLVVGRDGKMRLAHELASLKTLDRLLRAAGHDLADLHAPTIPPAAAAVFEDTFLPDAAAALAQTIVNTTRVLAFELAVVESALPPSLTARLVDATRRQIADVALPGPQTPPIIPGHLGRSGAAEGAALLRMHRMFFSRDFAHMVV